MSGNGAKGYLALALHAHLPYVRHPEEERFLEEEWFFEAITETYLPLLTLFEGLKKDGVPFRLTLTLSPTLLAMLGDDLLRERYLRHLDRLIDLAGREIVRTTGDDRLQELARMYHWRFESARSLFVETLDGDLISAFGRFEEEGYIEIITCGATHGFFPLLARNPSAVRAQVAVGRQAHEEALGRSPRGIWLPECGYYRGVESILRAEGIDHTFVDAHGLLHAEPRPRYGVFAPALSEGITLFGRDIDSSRQIWSAATGYPGDPVYRDFYRDIGFDLKPHELGPDHLQPTGLRKMSGIKYHRITGPEGVDKDIYHYRNAMLKVAEQADHFLQRRLAQFDQLAPLMDRPPLVVAPFDAELFGHWWFEGPEFLNALIRAIHRHAERIETVTPQEYLRRYPVNQPLAAAPSSWGLRGHAEVWLDESNHWIYPLLHAAADRMEKLASQPAPENILRARCLNQAARELLLAQSSDWPFMIKTGTVAPYAEKRLRDHLTRFATLCDMVEEERFDQPELERSESFAPLFPGIDYRIYSS